jgi:hypothetical protein
MGAALERGAVDGLSVERSDEETHDRFRDFWAAAGEDVHGGVAMLGPGVDGEVTLCDDDHATDALGQEWVKMG